MSRELKNRSFLILFVALIQLSAMAWEATEESGRDGIGTERDPLGILQNVSETIQTQVNRSAPLVVANTNSPVANTTVKPSSNSIATNTTNEKIGGPTGQVSGVKDVDPLSSEKPAEAISGNNSSTAVPNKGVQKEEVRVTIPNELPPSARNEFSLMTLATTIEAKNRAENARSSSNQRDPMKDKPIVYKDEPTPPFTTGEVPSSNNGFPASTTGSNSANKSRVNNALKETDKEKEEREKKEKEKAEKLKETFDILAGKTPCDGSNNPECLEISTEAIEGNPELPKKDLDTAIDAGNGAIERGKISEDNPARKRFENLRLNRTQEELQSSRPRVLNPNSPTRESH